MRLSLKLACLLGLLLAVPAIDAFVTVPAAEARAGGSYGGSRSSGYSSSRSSSSGSYSSNRRTGSYSGSGPDSALGGPIGMICLAGFMLLVVVGGVMQFIEDVQRKLGFDPSDRSGGRLDRLAELMPEAALRDPVWEEANLLDQAREHYMAVQRAWVKRDQTIAKDVMTPELYAEHKAETDAMIARGEVNVLQNLEILAARIVHMADHADDRQDEVWVRISAQAIDCLMNEHTGQVLVGDRNFTSLFTEVWKFKRDGATWRAAEIASADVFVPESFREAAGMAI